MPPKPWLLVQWVEERVVIPSYEIVSADSMINQETDLHVGKMTFIKERHGNSAKRAQILRISNDKRCVTEHKILLERQDHQVKNMITMCMHSIKKMKTDPLVYGTFNLSQINNEASGSGVIPPEVDASNASSDYRELTNEVKNPQLAIASVKTPAQKCITDYANQNAESPTIQRKRSVMSSTPLPKRRIETSDQATQTDPIRIISDEKFEELETTLTNLYSMFLSLIERIDIVDDDSDSEDGTVASDTENQLHEPTLNNSVVDSNASAMSLKVRRVSAHTTNTAEQSHPIDNDMVPIGAGNATVPTRVMNNINWDSYSSATRQLLQAIFPRNVLATHSLSGKRSPAFADKPVKKCLDPRLIGDIVDTVSERCGIPKRSVRNCITVKCADEAKLYRNRMQGRIPQQRQRSTAPENQENVPPEPSRVTSRSSTSSD